MLRRCGNALCCECVLVYGVPETRVSIESQFIVDNTEYKHGITNNYILLSKRASPLLFVLSSFLYLLTSWLFWPIIIQVPTSFTGGPPKLSIFLFCRTVFSTPWLDLDLQSGHSLLSVKLLLTFFNWLTAQTLLLCYIYYSKKWIFTTVGWRFREGWSPGAGDGVTGSEARRERGGSCRRVRGLESRDEGGPTGGIAGWNWERGRSCWENCWDQGRVENNIKRKG